MPAVQPPADGFVGKVKDVTGPGITDRWGMACTDLGASVRAANGALLSVFGDTFSGSRVGVGEWRSPVILIGTGDATHEIVYHRAAGGDPRYARQLWRYRHSTGGGLLRRGISTVIPSDLLRVGDDLFLHAIVNRGLGNVVWTEIWRSADNGLTWANLGGKFPASLHQGHGQCWSWDFDPHDGWIYVVSTGFQRNKGVILQRVRPQHLAKPDRYDGWDPTTRRWGVAPAPITPPGETWGELSLRRLSPGHWILGGFASSAYALGFRTIAAPTDDLTRVPLQRPIVGCGWDDEDHAGCRVAQLYGGYVLPGSRLDVVGGVGLMVSQWNTARGWPYRVMQFRVTLDDTTASWDRSS
jgi:hypothetical protein